MNILTTSLYLSNSYDNPFFSAIIILLFIGIVASCCFGEDNSSSSKSTYKKRSNTSKRYGTYNTYHKNDYDSTSQTSYDPTWDDDWFEKTGTEPWFDDNPWDHDD